MPMCVFRQAWAVHEACYPGDAGVKDVASADVAGFLGLMSGRIGDEPGAKQWLARSVAVFTGALAPAEGAPDTSMCTQRGSSVRALPNALPRVCTDHMRLCPRRVT